MAKIQDSLFFSMQDLQHSQYL